MSFDPPKGSIPVIFNMKDGAPGPTNEVMYCNEPFMFEQGDRLKIQGFEGVYLITSISKVPGEDGHTHSYSAEIEPFEHSLEVITAMETQAMRNQIN